jgi:hypothetical protein
MIGNDENIDWVALGRTLRELREKAGTPADVAARQLCLGKKQILALENGTSDNFPGVAARHWCAERYAAQFGVSLEQFSGQPMPEPVSVQEEAEVEVEALPSSTLVDSETLGRTGSPKGKLVIGIVLVVALLVVGLFNLTKQSPPEPAVEEPTSPPLVSAAPVAVTPAPVEPVAATPEPPAAPVTPEIKPKPPEQVADVQGINPEKSFNTLFIASREPVVLVTKRPGKGETSLNLDKGAFQRVTLTGDETVRVAQGKDLDMYFQGRKVAASMIEEGVWLRFIPLRPAAANP